MDHSQWLGPLCNVLDFGLLRLDPVGSSSQAGRLLIVARAMPKSRGPLCVRLFDLIELLPVGSSQMSELYCFFQLSHLKASIGLDSATERVDFTDAF